MKNKQLPFAILAVAPLLCWGAPADKPTLTPSRNVLLNVGGWNKTFVNFRLIGNVAIIENATPGSGQAKMIGRCTPFLPHAGTRTHNLRIPGWHTTWIFKPDGTAVVFEEPDGELGPAVQVQGKTLEWPKDLVDADTGKKKSGPQTRNVLVNIAGAVNDMINIRIQGNKMTVIASKRPNVRKAGSTGTFKGIGIDGYLYLKVPTWGTTLWFFYPDGTAAVKEDPWRDGQGPAIPVKGNTLEWPK